MIKSHDGSVARIIDSISVFAWNTLFSFAYWLLNLQDSGCQPSVTFPVQVRCCPVTLLFVPLLYLHHYTVRAEAVLSSPEFLTKYVFKEYFLWSYDMSGTVLEVLWSRNTIGITLNFTKWKNGTSYRTYQQLANGEHQYNYLQNIFWVKNLVRKNKQKNHRLVFLALCSSEPPFT